MIFCKRCRKRMFIDRAFSAINHIEIFCICCGSREFFHNFNENDKKAQLLLKVEKKRCQEMIFPL
jgi:hypothetical protein